MQHYSIVVSTMVPPEQLSQGLKIVNHGSHRVPCWHHEVQSSFEILLSIQTNLYLPFHSGFHSARCTKSQSCAFTRTCGQLLRSSFWGEIPNWYSPRSLRFDSEAIYLHVDYYGCDRGTELYHYSIIYFPIFPIYLSHFSDVFHNKYIEMFH